MANKPQDIRSLSDAFANQYDPYAGQFGKVEPGLKVGNPPTSMQDPFSAIEASSNPIPSGTSPCYSCTTADGTDG